jgi:hypothetical protein
LSTSSGICNNQTGETSPADDKLLLAALGKWAVTGPSLGHGALTLAAMENPRQRRVAFWERLAEMNSGQRNELLHEIICAAFREDRDGLCLLFTFLCGRPTTFLFPEAIAGLRHCRRLGNRLLFHKPPLPEEINWLERLRAMLPPTIDNAGFHSYLDGLGKSLLKMLSRPDRIAFPFAPELEAIIFLEGEAASLRGGRLVEAVGDYDPMAMSRLLPIVVALDEWQGDLHEFARKGAPALKHPLEQFIGGEDIKHWLGSLDNSTAPPDSLIANWIRWMNETELVGSEPAAWVSLLQTLAKRQYKRSITTALILPQCWRNRRLRLNKRPPSDLFSSKAVLEEDGYFWVDLDQLHWPEWVNPAGLPITPAAWKEEESPLLILRSRVQDDAFCERILSNDRWNCRQGVVEIIARGSRSLKILLKISGSRKLYAGAANRNVPLALLENPTSIPLSALRSLLNLRYLNRHDLTRLARGGPDVREEISREAQQVLSRS